VDPIEINENGPYLVYKPGYTAEFVRQTLLDRGLTGMHVRAAGLDETLDDLEFLREFSFLTQLQLNSIPSADYDYEFLSELTALEHLTVNVWLLPGVKAKRLNLAPLAALKSLNLNWREEIAGLEHLARLEVLRLQEHRGEDLRSISMLSGLKTLFVATSTIRSVSGIEHLRELDTLTLGACRRLSDLDGLATLERLRVLRLASCSKVTDLRPLSKLPELTDLTLEDCPKLASVAPLATLPLRSLRLVGTSEIGDADTAPLAHVPNLTYHHRKHYNVRIPTPLADAVSAETLRKLRGLP